MYVPMRKFYILIEGNQSFSFTGREQSPEKGMRVFTTDDDHTLYVRENKIVYVETWEE